MLERLSQSAGVNRQVLALSVARLGDAVGNSILFVIIPLYVAKLPAPVFGLPVATRVGLALSLYGLVAAIGQPLAGALSDRIGRRKPLILAGLLLMAICTLGFTVAGAYGNLLWLRALQGLAVALTIPTSLAIMSSATDKRTRGGSMGVYTTMRVVGLASGPLIAGLLYDRVGFNAAFYVGTGFVLAGAALVQAWVHDEPVDTTASRGRPFRLFEPGLLTPGMLGLGAATFTMAASFSMMGALENEFNARLDQSALAFGVAFSALMVSRLLLQFPIGRWSDSVGRKPFLIAGLILMAPATAHAGVRRHDRTARAAAGRPGAGVGRRGGPGVRAGRGHGTSGRRGAPDVDRDHRVRFRPVLRAVAGRGAGARQLRAPVPGRGGAVAGGRGRGGALRAGVGPAQGGARGGALRARRPGPPTRGSLRTPRGPMSEDHDELERMRRALEASGRYRVLERYARPARYHEAPAPDADLRTGLYVDVETTGLSASQDRIIELGLVAFEFDREGRIYRPLHELSAFEDPGAPLPGEITRLTGITDAMVADQRLPEDEVGDWLERAHLVIAHNAAFDRPFLATPASRVRCPRLGLLARDVPWYAEGFEGRKLEYLAMKQGFVFDGHRAASDCLAGIHLLSLPLPTTGRLALDALLERARRKGGRLYAVDSPFETKDRLKARGYSWNGRVWFRDLGAEELEGEADWLRAEIYGRAVPVPVFPVTAFERYSERIPAFPEPGAPTV